MKVGLLNPIAPETIGGGYTYEHEIFDRIRELAPSSRHEFVVFDDLDHLKPSKQAGKGSFLTRGFWSSLRKAIKGPPRRKGGYRCESKSIRDKLVSEGVEFFVNLSPELAILDVPFLAVVWDLQHRLQPFFPEVSGGVWRLRENFYSQVIRRAAFIVTGTNAGKEEVQRFYGVSQERVRVLPHPTPRFALEEGVADFAELARYNLPTGYVFYPAQFWSHKNHVGLLRAVSHLKRTENLSVPVVFTGSDQGNETYVRQMVEALRLQEQVYFLGHVPRAALRALYQHAFALCFVSFFGPDNLPPLEAFALGCPVIAANVPGASEQLGDAAVLVNPANELEIAQTLKSLLRDQAKRQSLIQRGKERAHRYTSEDFVKGLFALLDEFQTIRQCWSASPQFPSKV
jgi:glycosyltransferase involved in cell wall biosynthesis